jgi:prepilin-type N-terminal cleavage/methylation domain-containing protein
VRQRENVGTLQSGYIVRAGIKSPAVMTGLGKSRNIKTSFMTREPRITNAMYLRRVDGFTLLEILVAIALLAIVLTLVFELFSGSLRNIRASEDYLKAVWEGEVRLRRVLNDDNLQAGDFAEVTANGYRIETTISEVMKEKTDSLPYRAMEIDLAVKWNTGSKEKVTHLRTVKLVNKTQQGGTVHRTAGMSQ